MHARTGPAQALHPRSWSLLSTRSGSWPNPLCEARIFFARVFNIGCLACLPVLFLKLVISEVTCAAPWHGRARPEQSHRSAKASCAGLFQSAASHRCCLLRTIFGFPESPRNSPKILVNPKNLCNVRVYGEIVSVWLSCFY